MAVMNRCYDLHTHSTASDGTLTPAELVRHAADCGVDVLAITDHDSVEGIAEAQQAGRAFGVEVVAGIELSITWMGQVIHVVGLSIDPAAPELLAGLDRLCEFRAWRAEEMGRRLAQAGYAGCFEGAKALSNGRLISRTHFARHLVQRGAASDVRDVFKRFLVRGKPGHVPGRWAEPAEGLGWLRGAGGRPVLAHPARYNLTRSKLRRLVAELMEAGCEGIEVVSGSHSRDECLTIGRLAHETGLLASSGSDYHGPENPWVELGKCPPLPAGLTPVWHDWSPRAEWPGPLVSARS